MTAYYNEIDPYAAQWLRNLIAAGYIAPGDVDERDIRDVRPDDIKHYEQCHFFAGIGVWSYALRLAGWPDDRPVWTGSCPCQPFSAAGKGLGFADERHLWPAWHWLIAECRPSIIVGEQVASKNTEPWIDLVSVDMEALDFAFGALAFPAAGVGAPHIRDRTYWMAYAHQRASRQGRALDARRDYRSVAFARPGSGGGVPHSVDNAERFGRGTGRRDHVEHDGFFTSAAEQAGALADTIDRQLQETGRRSLDRAGQSGSVQIDCAAGPTNGFWRDADWLLCRDEKWRSVEPGTFPLANGVAARVGRSRAYGNAIVAPQATVFIESVREALDDYDLL